MYISSNVLMWNRWMIKSIVTPEVYTDYSAMRWPCPEWFHMPSYNERTSIKAMFTTMWANVNSWTFKVPSTWAYYYGLNNTKSWINQIWSIRCCNTYNDDNWAMIYNMKDVYAVPKNALMPIRALKDVPVIPDSSWSIIYDWSSTAAWAWIFWSEGLWLFSISSDWVNWKTLADKNIWATQVWTNKTAACVWYLFQRWNNYWFTYANNPTFPSTTSTQVDTTWYWPGNYYSSNTYYDKWSDWDWSFPSNNNLRWWQTWAVQKHITTKWVVIYPPQEEQTWYQEVEYIESWSDWNAQYISMEFLRDNGAVYTYEIDVSNVWSATWQLFSYRQAALRIYKESVSIDQDMYTAAWGSFTPSTYSINWRYLYEWWFVNNEVDYVFNLLSDANFRLYSFKAYKDWTLFRDMIPCYDRSNWEIWMYDMINDVFYTNQWMWSFVKWPDVV